MGTVIKVECDGQLRRALLKGTPSYDELNNAVQKIWPGRSAEGAVYTDDVGNSRTLNEQTFSDFLLTAKQAPTGSILSFQLSSDSSLPETTDTEAAPKAKDAFSQPWELVEECAEEDGEEKIHTVADLTDILDDTDATQELSQGVATSTPTSATQPEAAASATATVGSQSSQGYSAPMAMETSPGATGSCTTSSSGLHEALPDHAIEEKVDIVLAAFDEDGDGQLNFQESNELHSAWGEELSPMVFEELCKEHSQASETGLDKVALVRVYKNSFWNLEIDFAAAMSKLGAA